MIGQLVVDRISKSFGGNQAVSDVSTTINRGEIVGLVGPNGAGKSTYINLLTGQYTPDAGRVTVEGVEVTKLAPSHRGRFKVVRSYQDAGMFLRLSAIENVIVAAVARGMPMQTARARSREILDELGLRAVAHQRAERLSGGQRKLVDVARCLISDAVFILLDEPTAGVNMATADLLTRLIADRRAAGAGILVVSHDLRWAFPICSRVVVLAQGSLIAEGTADEVMQNPAVIEAYLT
jgi:ABC-type branched-subunit amino acid transport system ATPase component